MFLSRQLRSNVASVYRINTPIVFFFLNRNYVNPSTSDQEVQEQIAQARTWLSSFTPEKVPRKKSNRIRGQNVNKLNTKATLRLDLTAHGHFINPYILEKVRQNSTYITKHDELVIQCDTHRNQNKNTEECFGRLYLAILKAANLPGETSEKALEKVAKIEKKNKERRIQDKKVHSSKKGARRGPRAD